MKFYDQQIAPIIKQAEKMEYKPTIKIYPPMVSPDVRETLHISISAAQLKKILEILNDDF